MSELDTSPARRMGPEGSATWNLMLDGAEAILREEGYAELTSRRVAERIGVKQRLVYYYFHTMEDLMVACLRRSSERELKRLEAALHSARPVHEIWEVCIHTADARMISEFMAVANHSEQVRTEVIHFVESSRRLQIEAVTRAIEATGSGLPSVSPAALSFLATSVALALNREASIGVSMAHGDVEALIAGCLRILEPN